ncbi:MAG TPA: 16S rRNA (guanine(966)-N(2))-methyltransferase RsmD [Vicinamibacteria bacterium]|nr:16S rRNA (guanine(966)-N(2))-methyltransferase RsmD [Vicinamibacteria bacterium]
MTRIIGGTGKGRRLRTPRGDLTRPTGARVRQALFDILAPRIPGCRFLDAFAGNGGVGLEALSRGAAREVRVDRSRAAVGAIRENARAVQAAGGEVQVYHQETRLAMAALADSGVRFDVVYLDPPYDSPLYEPLLEESAHLLEKAGVVVAEHFHKRSLPETIGRLARTRDVRIGDHRLTFYARQDGGEASPGASSPTSAEARDEP